MSTLNESFTTLKPLAREAAAKVKAAAASVAQPAVEHPGVERWPVKTGTDVDVAKVGINNVNGEDLGPGIVDTTVEEMVAFPRPANMPPVHSTFALKSFYQDRRAGPGSATTLRSWSSRPSAP
jgi:hypothetical protein